MVKILIAAALLLMVPSSVHAQTSLIIKPAFITLTAASGSASVTLFNAGDNELDVQYTTLRLEPGKDGQLNPVLPIKPVTGITALNRDTQDSEVTLLSGTSEQIRFTIPTEADFTNTIPAILFTTQPEQTPKEKTVSSLAGGIIVPILRLGESAKQELKVSSFTTPGITTSNILPFGLTVQNPGKVPTQVSGTIAVKNILDQEVANFQLPVHIVLPQQYRNLLSDKKVVWDPKLILGIYQVELQLKYGDKTTVHRKIVFGFPYRYAALLGISAIIISGVYLRVRKYQTK